MAERDATTDGILDEVLDEILAKADLRLVLMCLVHLTGDLAWLEPPFRPTRDVRLVPDPRAGLPDEVQDRIRTAVRRLLQDGVPDAAIVDPGDELMQRMMSVCLGEEVPAEYAPMMRGELGLVATDPAPSTPLDADHEPHVLVVGAGISGIAMGAALGRVGVGYTIVEQREEVGGTWWDNRYPGCGVDTPNHAYSYSHSYGSGEPFAWSRYFSKRDEIEQYLQRCADEFEVRPNVRFGTEVCGASWDEAAQQWHVSVRDDRGEHTLVADVLVSAIGLLHVPRMPQVPGMESFEGLIVHPSRWPDDLDLRGKRVAVVGTGATAMQLVPTIADEVAALTVYQRSPQWARDIGGYRDTIPTADQWLFEHLPFYARWFRFAMFWRYGDGLLVTLRKDPDWPYPERSMNRRNERHRVEMAEFIERELAGRPDLLEQCLPDYPPYGKRILIDNGWFRTLTRPHVELVTDAIDHLDAGAVVTADGTRREADVVVFATGFHVMEMAARLGLRGRDGIDLADVWADENASAHLGITVPGFPNLFCMGGPNTGLGHGGSGMFVAECQTRYIVDAVEQMRRRGLRSLEVRREVHDEYVARVDAEHEQLIWTHPGMTNWYRNRAGRIVAIMPWRLVDYWQMTREVRLDDFV
ncbi:MAG: NAD(P)/FAD-dependent oxidoreductase [Actinobacteria bacterium]|nr:NAD(P)/FAD-dependent oxidoreductase [Actinomycetota bacterium]